ncbi:DUF3108 domain-containing protein [Caminibacter pacificus]|jgi:hypothetical protein
MRYILLFLIAIFAYSKTYVATYSAKYGWFGTIATAKGVYERNETDYKIMTTVKTKGFAASISGHLTQTYISEGKVINGRLVPTHYIVDIKRNGDDYYRIYIFDHKNKSVIKKRYKNGKLTKEYKYYYAPDDILTLYWNLPLYLKDKKETYIFHAVGGSKKNGKVEITFPQGEELKELKKTFKVNGTYLKANLYNKVFAGDKGVLYLVIDPTNWVTVAGMVKNVLKIGDLKGKMDYLKIEDK